MLDIAVLGSNSPHMKVGLGIGWYSGRTGVFPGAKHLLSVSVELFPYS